MTKEPEWLLDNLGDAIGKDNIGLTKSQVGNIKNINKFRNRFNIKDPIYNLSLSFNVLSTNNHIIS